MIICNRRGCAHNTAGYCRNINTTLKVGFARYPSVDLVFKCVNTTFTVKTAGEDIDRSHVTTIRPKKLKQVSG